MADEQSSNPPNQPAQQAQPAAQPPQPPPPPANAQEIIAAQQAALAKQIAEAQQRDRAQFGPAAGETAPPAPVLGGALARASAAQQGQQGQQQPAPAPQGYNLPQGMTPQQVAQGGFPGAQMQQPPPPQPQFQAPQQGLMGMPHPSVAQQGGMQPPDFSRLPDPSVPQTGVTIQQLAAGAQVQGGYAPQYGQQQQQQAQQQDATKVRVLWHPARNSNLVIELDDSFIAGLPDDVKKETDPQAKVVAVLLLEILSLRLRVQELEKEGGSTGLSRQDFAVLSERVYRLEQTLFEQRAALNQGARAYREEQERLAMEELKKKQESGEE